MKPNIIMVLFDATRSDHLSCYGYNRQTTPFLEQLANKSTLFERAYSQSIWTLPSYASLFTGKYPSQHGAVDWNATITDPTFVDKLNQKGYSTHTISAHLGGSDGFGIANAFDTREEIKINSRDFLFPDDPVFEEIEERRKANTYDSRAQRYLAAAQLAMQKRSLKSIPNFLYHQYQMLRRQHGFWTDNGANEIVNKAKNDISTAESPYFLFLDFLEAHQPYRPPRGYIREFLPEDISIDEMNAVIDANHIGKTITGQPFDDRERRILQGLYDGAIRYLDDQIRDLYTYLEEIGQAEDTVFIVLADHGDCFGEWGLWGHQGRIHNRLNHVPLIINYPWNSGHRESQIVELRQLFDHLNSLGEGVEPAADDMLQPQGEALTEYYGLDTQVSITPWEAYEEATMEEWGSYQVSLVRDQWRFFYQVNETGKLYHVATDPDERENVIENYEDVAIELHNRVESIVGSAKENHQEYRSDSQTNKFGVNEDVEDHLEELGYM